MPIASVNPATGELLRTFTALTESEIDRKIQKAHDAYRRHRRTTLDARAAKMCRAAEILESEKESLARTITLEMGKPLQDSIGEVMKCAWGCRYYSENAASMLADEPIATNASLSYVSYQPLGVILAVMPWNFPFWQVFRFACPALMAGNTGLLKHSSNVPQSALAIEDIFHRAGFDEGVFQTLLIESSKVQAILEDSRVVAATLTGSEGAGRSVASIAGKQIKKTVLELGGSDPFIVMPSASLADAAQTAVKARAVNNGQSCIAAKRFFVHDSIYAEFERRFIDGMQSLKVGDPLDPATQLGPQSTEQGVRDLEDQVGRAVAAGARLLTGGKRINRPGYFFEATILADVPKTCPVYYEEIFGPVAMLFRIRNIDEAIALANDSTFGLGASAWTNDDSERQQFARELEAGQVFLNGMVASDPRLPFGGIKNSGYGRELSYFGLREFVNAKTVWIK